MSHSLGSPTAAKITDKLTYKEFLFCEKTPKVSSGAAGRRDAPRSGSLSSSTSTVPRLQLPKVPKRGGDATAVKTGSQAVAKGQFYP